MGEEARYVARYASVYVRGNTFTEVGDELHRRGFDLPRAAQTERGVLVIPHKEENRQAAHLFAMLDNVEVAEKPLEDIPVTMSLDAPDLLDRPPTDPDERAAWARARVDRMRAEVDAPMSLDVASAFVAGAEVESGAVSPIPLTCGDCGSMHPEGVICLVPVFYESAECCHAIVTYGHDGPHEAATPDGVITHRWITEMVVTDLPFNAYGTFDPTVDGAE